MYVKNVNYGAKRLFWVFVSGICVSVAMYYSEMEGKVEALNSLHRVIENDGTIGFRMKDGVVNRFGFVQK